MRLKGCRSFPAVRTELRGVVPDTLPRSKAASYTGSLLGSLASDSLVVSFSQPHHQLCHDHRSNNQHHRINHITPFVTHIKFTTAGIIHPVATMSTPVYMEFSEKFSELTWLVAR